MSEVRVIGVAVDSAGQRVILLKPTEATLGIGKILPIWVGEQEATSILVAIEGLATPRPFAHELMRSLLDALDAQVDRVEITNIADGTFYAVVYLQTASGEHVVDARPSDAIALASRTGSPIHVADAVLEEAGIEDTITMRSNDDDDEVSEEARLDEFRAFLDTVDPEDFGEE
jgi:bifunctional DNase/RNase